MYKIIFLPKPNFANILKNKSGKSKEFNSSFFTLLFILQGYALGGALLIVLDIVLGVGNQERTDYLLIFSISINSTNSLLKTYLILSYEYAAIRRNSRVLVFGI